MSIVKFLSSFVSYEQSTIIYISTSNIDIELRDSFFSHCFCEETASVLYFISENSFISKVCGFNCSSLNSTEPGGSFFRIKHEKDDEFDVKLQEVSTFQTSNNLKPYSSITLYYGLIEYKLINCSLNKASFNPSFYILSSSGENPDAKGSFLNIINCYAIGEIILNGHGNHHIDNMNLINCTNQNNENGVFRNYNAIVYLISCF